MKNVVTTLHLLIECIEPQQCTVMLEPYGAEHVLMAENHLRLTLESTEDVSLELAYSPGCITLWLPPSIVNVQATNRLGESVDLGLPI